MSTETDYIKQETVDIKGLLRNATKVPEDTMKIKFGKIYGDKIRIAPQPKDDEYESMQELMWRHLVVRSTIGKIKTKFDILNGKGIIVQGNRK